MFRDDVQLITDERVNFVLNHGALGDVITSLPAIIHARKTQPNELKMKIWAPSWQNDLVKHLLAPYGEFELLHMEDFPLGAVQRKEQDVGPTALNQAPFNTHTRNRVHMVDYSYNFLLDSAPENMEQRSYPTLAPLGRRVYPSQYLVFAVGAGSDNRLFRASVMAPIMQWAWDNGYQSVIVGTRTSFIGAESDGKMEPIVLRDEVDKLPPELLRVCQDLREKTTLLQLRDICGYARAVIGIDGGTLHLAGTTDTNIVYGMTTVLPKHRYIPRHGDPSYKIRYVGPRDLACAGCQSNWLLMFHHDFRHCMYGDNLCVDKMHPEDFINGLKELGL